MASLLPTIGEGDGVVHHLGAIYPPKDGSEIEHWTLCGVAGIVAVGGFPGGGSSPSR